MSARGIGRSQHGLRCASYGEKHEIYLSSTPNVSKCIWYFKGPKCFQLWNLQTFHHRQLYVKKISSKQKGGCVPNMHIKFIQIFMHGSVRIMIIMQLATAPSHQRSLYQHEVGSFLRDGGQRSKTNIEADALTIDQHSSKILLKRWSATSALLALQFFLVVVATGCEQALPDIRGLPTYLRI